MLDQKRTIPENNVWNSFPLRNTCCVAEYVQRLGGSPLLLSGGTEGERAAFLAAALSHVPDQARRVVLHSGNHALTPEALIRQGLPATAWNRDPPSGTVWSAAIGGGNEAAARRRLDLLLDHVERGEPLVLAVDGLSLRHPLLEQPIPGVRLLRSAPDLSALPGGLEALPVQGCGVVLLRHTSYESAKQLSPHLLGTYECLIAAFSPDYRQGRAERLPDVRNVGMNIRRKRKPRLAPRALTMLPPRTACATLPDGWEGVVQLKI